MSAGFAAVAGERLSPILVKELRQGLRAATFTGAFLLIHVLMIASVLLSLNDPYPRRAFPFGWGSFIFWATVWLWSVLILPARAYAELRRELRDRTLELTFLTRLTAWRIIGGKWLSVFLQTLLVLSAVLPYAMLRYFVGRVDLVSDLLGLAAILFTSAVATALMLVAAACQSWMLNVALAIGGLFVLPWGSWIVAAISRPMRGMGVAPTAGGVLLVTLLPTAASTLFLLEYAASRIAPPAENHAFRKRVLALGALGAAALAWPIDATLGATLATVAGTLVLLVCMDALCERPVPIASLYRPFVHRGGPVRVAGLAFYPGWPSGVLFGVVALACLAALLLLHGGDVAGVVRLSLVVPALLILPLAIRLVLAPRSEQRWTWYIAVQLAGALVAVVWLVVASWIKRTPSVECLCPAVTAGAFLLRSGTVGWACEGANLVTLVTAGVVLVGRGRAAWRDFFAAERRAAARVTARG